MCPYVWLVFKSGLYSRADYDGARTKENLSLYFGIIDEIMNQSHIQLVYFKVSLIPKSHLLGTSPQESFLCNDRHV